jgi:hypothetical protein
MAAWAGNEPASATTNTSEFWRAADPMWKMVQPAATGSLASLGGDGFHRRPPISNNIQYQEQLSQIETCECLKLQRQLQYLRAAVGTFEEWFLC